MSALQSINAKEHPMLFGGDMVRALLNGKTQTRRPITPENIRFFNGSGNSWKPSKEQLEQALTEPVDFRQLGYDIWTWKAKAYDYQQADQTIWFAHCKWAPRHRIWVRENWTEGLGSGFCQPFERYKLNDGNKWGVGALYQATKHPDYNPGKWRASIHMPRWASRLTLEITGVRIERIQDISEADAIAEGLTKLTKDYGRTWKYGIPDPDGLPGPIGWQWQEWRVNPCQAFKKLWESTYPCSWDRNDHVFVLDFKRVEYA